MKPDRHYRPLGHWRRACGEYPKDWKDGNLDTENPDKATCEGCQAEYERRLIGAGPGARGEHGRRS